MICIEHGHIYKLEESFDVYMCDAGRITARSGAVFIAERGSNRIVNGRELPFYNIYFLGSKKYLPYSAACLFQSAEGIKIKEIDLKDLDVTTFSGYLPWNLPRRPLRILKEHLWQQSSLRDIQIFSELLPVFFCCRFLRN